jgi:hypothetical protein
VHLAERTSPDCPADGQTQVAEIPGRSSREGPVTELRIELVIEMEQLYQQASVCERRLSGPGQLSASSVELCQPVEAPEDRTVTQAGGSVYR